MSLYADIYLRLTFVYLCVCLCVAALRRSGPARSGPLVGTCPDMCPEKERYMREEKHQISSQYERDRHGQVSDGS